eukprot:scaffold14448_cov63-Phaeocystis_antarctica.AAC.2
MWLVGLCGMRGYSRRLVMRLRHPHRVARQRALPKTAPRTARLRRRRVSTGPEEREGAEGVRG